MSHPSSELVSDSVSKPVKETTATRLVSFALPSPGVTLTAFLRAAHSPRFAGGHNAERFAWHSPDGETLAGIGVAFEASGWGEARFDQIALATAECFAGACALNEAPAPARPRMFGGFAFSDNFVPDVAWTDFRPAHFILPHVQYSASGGDAWLTMNVRIDASDDPTALRGGLEEALRGWLALLSELPFAPLAPTAAPPFVSMRYPMSFEDWSAVITSAQARMRAGELQKVVLARMAEAGMSAPADVDAAFDRVRTRYPTCTAFLFEPRPGSAFLGATPELLIAKSGSQIRTMALAGTIRRGRDGAEDAQLEQQILADPKERLEHALVVDRIRAKLEGLGARVDASAASTLALPNLRHLITQFEATLPVPEGGSTAPNLLNLVQAWHPTPALGGEPRALALKLISEGEHAPRGWYAAPVGWIDGQGDGAFVVAIRSAVAQHERIWLYAGCGIVAASVPRKEWAECELKLKPMMEAFGL